MNASNKEALPTELRLLAEISRNSLSQRGWKYEEKILDEIIQFKMHINLQNVNTLTSIDCSEGNRLLTVFSYAPYKVPEEIRTDVVEYLTRVNYCLSSPKFEMDLWDGEIRVTGPARFREADATEKLVEDMVRQAHGALDEYLPGILMMGYGQKTVREAWEATLAEGETLGSLSR